MSRYEIILYCGFIFGIVLWTIIVHAITSRKYYGKGYDDGVEVGLKRLDRREKFEKFNNDRKIFRRRVA